MDAGIGDILQTLESPGLFRFIWETITGNASAIIALCALGFSIWQGFQIRKHNKISFRPHLTTWSHSDQNTGTYSVDLINNGLGPAVIKSFTVTIDEKRISGDGTEPIDKAVKTLFPLEKFNAYYEYLGENYAMGAKDKCRVVSIKFYGDKLPSRDYVEHTISRADLQVKYESFYHEPFFFNSSDKKPNR